MAAAAEIAPVASAPDGVGRTEVCLRPAEQWSAHCGPDNGWSPAAFGVERLLYKFSGGRLYSFRTWLHPQHDRPYASLRHPVVVVVAGQRTART